VFSTHSEKPSASHSEKPSASRFATRLPNKTRPQSKNALLRRTPQLRVRDIRRPWPCCQEPLPSLSCPRSWFACPVVEEVLLGQSRDIESVSRRQRREHRAASHYRKSVALRRIQRIETASCGKRCSRLEGRGRLCIASAENGVRVDGPRGRSTRLPQEEREVGGNAGAG